MSTWHRIASVAECPPGQAIERVLAGQIVALFNVDDRVALLACPAALR